MAQKHQQRILQYSLISLIVFFILMQHSAGQESYADVSMRVDDTGTAYITGASNFAGFGASNSEYFTSKRGPYWLLNISTNETFSDYYISIEFPKGTEINYMKAKGSFRITEGPALTLIASGQDEPVQIEVQYRISQEAGTNYIYPAILISLGLAALASYLYFRKKTTKKHGPAAESQGKNSRTGIDIIYHTLTDNQKKIINILIEAKAPITQKQVQHRANLPKATLSRNIDLLCMKKIIRKESRGMTNMISINDSMNI